MSDGINYEEQYESEFIEAVTKLTRVIRILLTLYPEGIPRSICPVLNKEQYVGIMPVELEEGEFNFEMHVGVTGNSFADYYVLRPDSLKDVNHVDAGGIYGMGAGVYSIKERRTVTAITVHNYGSGLLNAAYETVWKNGVEPYRIEDVTNEVLEFIEDYLS